MHKIDKKQKDRFKRELKRRLELRNRIYNVQTKAYGNGNKIADHYFRKDENLPIWATFELISFGEFGHFVSCLNQDCRKKISTKLGIRQSDDTNAILVQRLIYATKDLRNSIAHNDVIFDTRFKTGRVDSSVSNAISNVTNINDLNFYTITDYLVLIIYQLKLLHISKTEMKRIIAGFENATEKLRNNIPVNIYNQIIHTDNATKILQLKHFI